MIATVEQTSMAVVVVLLASMSMALAAAMVVSTVVIAVRCFEALGQGKRSDGEDGEEEDSFHPVVDHRLQVLFNC